MSGVDALGHAWRLLREAEHALAIAVGESFATVCAARVATLLEAPADPVVGVSAAGAEKIASLEAWPSSPLFSSGERACLALTEQLVIDPSGVGDDLVADVERHLGPSGTYTFARWVQATEARRRAQLLLRHHEESARFR